MYIGTYVHKPTLFPPPNVHIILFDIKMFSFSISIGFPLEFRISSVSGSSLFFLGFISVIICQMLCQVEA